MADTLRVGLLGYGLAGRSFHAPLIRTTPGLAIAAVATREAANVHADLGEAVAVSDWQTIVARPDIDLVVIATPNTLHAPQALAALAAGKHVVVDKPMALDADEAARMVDAASGANRLLGVFHNRRWDGDFLTVERVLRAGTLGRVVALTSRFDRFRPQVPDRWRDAGGPGSGVWIDLGPHLVDQAMRLFGAPSSIAAEIARVRDGARADDWFHAMLRYGDDGPRVHLGASTLAAIPDARFVVHGTSGSLRIDGVDGQEDALRRGELPGPGWGVEARRATLVLGDGAGTRSESIALEPGGWPTFYAGVRDAILGRGPAPVPVVEALAVQRLIGLGLQASAERREVNAR